MGICLLVCAFLTRSGCLGSIPPTVQRWEAFGLPVHRMGPDRRAPIVAFTEELDAWERTAPRRLLDEIIELKNKVNSLEAEVISLKDALKLKKRTSAHLKSRTTAAN